MSDNEIQSDTESLPEEAQFHYQQTFVLFAIDTHESMFVEDESEKTPFWNCLKACFSIADSLVLADSRSTKSPLGIIFANEPNANFVDFTVPIPDAYKLLKKTANLDPADLEKRYKRKGDFDMAEFFLLCKKKFVNIKQVDCKKIIVYITNDDDPTQDDQKKKSKVLNEVQNFPLLNMSLHLITMNNSFDYNKFYTELMHNAKGDMIEKYAEDLDGLTDKLSTYVQLKYFQFHFKLYPFKNDRKRYLQVVIKNFIAPSKLLTTTAVTRDTHELVKKMYPAQPQGNYMFEFQWSKDYEFKMHLTKAEKDEIFQTNFPCGYSMLFMCRRKSISGLVPVASSLMMVHPKEELPFFDILWQYCVDNLVVIICARKHKVNGKLTFVELCPKFVNKNRTFLVAKIPTGDDIINLPSTSVKHEITKEEKKAASDLIEALTFPYDPRMIPDVVYRKKKNYIKAEILGQSPEDADDVTVNDHALDEMLRPKIQQFKKLLMVDPQPGSKRPASSKYRKPKKEK